MFLYSKKCDAQEILIWLLKTQFTKLIQNGFTIQFVFAISKRISKMQNVEHTYWRKKDTILDGMF